MNDKKPRNKHEHRFEKDIEFFASINGMTYIKIPDPIYHTGKFHGVERQRPFDGILVTPTANYCVECKYGKNQLEPHQKDWRDVIDSINPNGFVLLRKVDEDNYQIEVTGYKTEKFKDVQDMIKCFKNPAIQAV